MTQAASSCRIGALKRPRVCLPSGPATPYGRPAWATLKGLTRYLGQIPAYKPLAKTCKGFFRFHWHNRAYHPNMQATVGLLLCLSTFPVFAVSSIQELTPRSDLHFPLHARGTNWDGSVPVYKNANADIETRIADLLPRMTIEEKVAQM